MTSSHFLWPQPKRLRALFQAPRCVAIPSVEDKLAEMFKGGSPVLFSSGRAALAHALMISGLARGDKAGVFPFASHCVLDAVSRIATPAAVGRDTSLNVVFQQWGYIQHLGLSSRDVEDCVDSLLVPGGKLFPGGGGFEVWSLPKILGTTGGGVLWCRSAEAASALRQLRDGRKGSSLLWGLRLLGMHSSLLHAFWQGAEALLGRPSRLQTGEILAALDVWGEIVADRQKKLDLAWALAPQWLRRPADRLPCVVPVELSNGASGEQLARLAGISSGTRMIEHAGLAGTSALTRVLPIPIHQDVTCMRLGEMIDCIAGQVRSCA